MQQSSHTISQQIMIGNTTKLIAHKHWLIWICKLSSNSNHPVAENGHIGVKVPQIVLKNSTLKHCTEAYFYFMAFNLLDFQ